MGVLIYRILNEKIQAIRRATTGTTDCEIWIIYNVTMTAEETISEFLDRIGDCIAEIRARDSS